MKRKLFAKDKAFRDGAVMEESEMDKHQEDCGTYHPPPMKARIKSVIPPQFRELKASLPENLTAHELATRSRKATPY
jgi:hypothetical protein